MALRGTDPESYITEYTLVYETAWWSGIEERESRLEGHGNRAWIGDVGGAPGIFSSSSLLLSSLQSSDTTVY